MQGLRCIGCGGWAPYMFQGSSYCHGHLRAAQRQANKMTLELPVLKKVLDPHETELDSVSE